ncbi:polysaccharide pyruvyl transferase family protein [Nitratireductor kimnyeongensis]|uniref:Polysaccharide pyruvyl transferase family protein n=1 Tax=Nitratireductor kimnyeongensis TaxID=430679 RepID=A0ABW0T7Y2_9HYPH|nr:polysaccharide pyruvyl transferase family protein [Nitratireductor kimnyeongensis]QZZ36038.1 polysaccharide pyruvyl transferase family protein [Nitratireductor kimnyeongensis]
MKIAALSFQYPTGILANIGDWIQTLAVEQHLPKVDFYLDRDSLNTYDGDECMLVMNGWFSHRPQAWPPSEKITPIFHGFHITPGAAEYYRKHLDYFKKHAPIGCRDQSTLEIIQSWGVQAYLSYCATLTFPTRTQEPEEELVILVDAPKPAHRVKRWKSKLAIQHEVAPVSSPVQRAFAKDLLALYRDKASLVVTSRIHAAMPCMAMGIPTLYMPKKPDGRTNIINEFGAPTIQAFENGFRELFGFREKKIFTKNKVGEKFKNQISTSMKSRVEKALR